MAQKEKNIFLVFPLALIALEIRNMNNGVAENAYKTRRIFIGLLYQRFQIILNIIWEFI